MIDIHFAAPDMAHLDALRNEALVVTFFADECPLRGAGGLIDWRLCGYLSRRMQDGFISGHYGETVLVPGQGRLPTETLLMVGLGSAKDLTAPRSKEVLEGTLDCLSGMGVRSAAMVLPGRSTGALAPDAALEALVAAAGHATDPDELVILESPEAQRIMAPIVDRERRRDRARDL